MLPTCVVVCLAFVSARCLAMNTLLLDGVNVSPKAGEHGQSARVFDVLLLRDFMFVFSSSSREVVNTEGGHVFRTIARVPPVTVWR